MIKCPNCGKIEKSKKVFFEYDDEEEIEYYCYECECGKRFFIEIDWRGNCQLRYESTVIKIENPFKGE